MRVVRVECESLLQRNQINAIAIRQISRRFPSEVLIRWSRGRCVRRLDVVRLANCVSGVASIFVFRVCTTGPGSSLRAGCASGHRCSGRSSANGENTVTICLVS